MNAFYSVELFKSEGEALVEAHGVKYRITIADYERSGIVQGGRITEESLEFLTEAEEKLRCIKKAFNYLSYKAHSKRGLGKKLKNAAFSDTAIVKTLFLLEEKGYLDDLTLCKEYAEYFQKRKNYGVMRIKKELYAKGFDKEAIDRATDELDETPEGVITELLLKKFPHLNPEDRQARAKAVSFLTARGFGYDEINNAICAFKSEYEEE